MIWEELSRIALIGTERAGLSAHTLAALASLGTNVEEGDARALLEGAAIYHPLRQAGFPLLRHEGPAGAASPSTEAGKPLSIAAAQHLRLILEGRFPQALPVYLALRQQQQQHLPPEYLPPLFRLALKHPELWGQLRPSIGPAGHWLLRQNPEWQALSENPGLEGWPDASPLERQAMLRYLRRTQPEQAAALLLPGWEATSPGDKQALLRLLPIGLGQYDEPFLEACLGDRRKEVRLAAAALLSSLPSSALAQRLFARAQTLLDLKGKGMLLLHCPQELSDSLKRDGIGAGGKNKFSGNQPAAWAFEILAQIPPKRWEEHFGLPTLESLRLLAASKDKDLLVEAAAQAALLHQDHRWIEAILRFWWRTNDEQAWKSPTGKLLIRQLPGPAFNELALQQLQQQPGPIEEKSLLFLLLSQGIAPWENKLALLFLKGFQDWMSATRSFHWNLWHYKLIMESAAYKINPQLLEGLRSSWPTRSPVWPHWEKEVEKFQRALAFRQEMLAG